MKPISFAGLLAIVALFMGACSQEGKLSLATVDQYEQDYRSIEDSLTLLNEAINANLMAMTYPFTGGRGQGGVVDQVEEYAFKNPLEALPMERQVEIKMAFAPVNESLNALNTRITTLRDDVYTLFNDLKRLRTAVDDQLIDEEIKTLHLSVQERIPQLRAATATMATDVQAAQDANKAFLQSDDILQNGYAWLIASSPLN